MISEKERREILELVAQGKMTADEAAGLLSGEPAPAAAGSTQPAESVEVPPTGTPEKVVSKEAEAPLEGPSGKQPSWLHIKVNDLRSGKGKVRVNIPLRLVKVGMQLGSGFAPELREVDWDELNYALASGEKGILIDVEDEEDGEHVQIYVD